MEGGRGAEGELRAGVGRAVGVRGLDAWEPWWSGGNAMSLAGVEELWVRGGGARVRKCEGGGLSGGGPEL